jgi:hypothetical protein
MNEYKANEGAKPDLPGLKELKDDLQYKVKT